VDGQAASFGAVCGGESEGRPLRGVNDRKPMEITVMELKNDRAFGRFDVHEIAKSFPPTADTLLLDTYLTNEEAASARIFRVYKETPPHYHATCDEYLYVLSGRGTFWMGSPENTGEFVPGNLLFFKRGTVHALPGIVEWPVVFLSIDTPRRDPKDIIFVDPEDGTPEKFIRQRR
jgi:mannose-6-phosphate isomerase-like protein (cupin superfamily)